MEKNISPFTEEKLTRAIRKAASFAQADESRDRSALLASCLMDAGLDARFAGTATAGFNRTLTLDTFRKTADEHRGDTFALADPDKVLGAMGAAPLTKAASAVRAVFSMRMVPASGETLQKTASAAPAMPARRPYEETVQHETLLRHIDSLMTKCAARYSELIRQLDNEKAAVARTREEVADHFIKTGSDTFEFSTMCNLFGDNFRRAMRGAIPGADFRKTAYAVDPHTEISEKVAGLIKAAGHVSDMTDALADYGEGLDELYKSAAGFGEQPVMEYDADTIREIQALSDDADISRRKSLGSILLRSSFANTMAVRKGLQGLSNAVSDAYSVHMDNARKMRDAVRGTEKPSDILGSDFIVRDRYKDRLMGWSDMSADPALAMYPAEQVFAATQKVMDMAPALERPDNRELLRAQVSQLLAQNNRASTADLAALAETLKSMPQGQSGLSEAAAAAVRGLNPVEGAAPVELASTRLIGRKEDTKDYIGDAAAANEKERENFIALVDKAQDKVDNLKRKSKESRQAREEAAQKASQQEARDKAQADTGARTAFDEYLHRMSLEDARNDNSLSLEELRHRNRMEEIKASREGRA